MRNKVLFNDGWMFTKQPLGTELTAVNDQDTKWQAVDLPHDWLIYNAGDLYENSVGWYKKTFFIEDLSDRIISLCFEGVYMDSTVYINNEVVGEWKYGYSSFEFDVTRFLKTGENEVKVRVVHQSPNSRWYSGAGIYRNVWLKTTALTCLVTDGIYISTKKLDDTWRVELEAEAISDKKTDVIIKHTVFDKEGNAIASSYQDIALDVEVTVDKQVMSVWNPVLWDLNNPYSYKLKTEVIINGSSVDSVTQSFGFRTTRFDNNEGFFLNDKYVKLHGSCEHHDLGALGAAMNKVALQRQLTILKDMGINAIRTAHNMPAVELMDLADEMGMLIVSEAFDMWEGSKTKYDYARFFKEWHDRDVASWIRRDRNRPSLIMWSIGNEIYDTHAGPRGLEVTKMLRDLVLKHDPKRNGLITIGSNFMAWENAQKCAAEIDVVGYNYAEYLYDDHHKKYPDWVIYGSETASTLQSRGIYHFPASLTTLTHEDEQCSSYDNCTTTWGAKSTQKVIIDDRDAKYCLGQFIWTGFDYIGEPTPYTTKNSYFGQVDTAGFKKDSFYLYQAEWTDYKVKPMVHILPYWDFNEGQLIDIRIYSNAPKTELFFNDESLGVFKIDHETGKQLSGEWQIPYKPGTIKAVAYDEHDNIIAEDSQTSFGDAERLVIKADKREIQANGLDLIFVEISTVDQAGNPVQNANNRVEVEVTGAGRLVGLDNGDSTDYDQYKGTSRRLFSGRLLAIIAAKMEPGDIKVKVTSKGLASAELDLQAVPGFIVPGVSAIQENQKSEPNDEVPVRKIELTNLGANQLSKETNITWVTAKIYPANATYNELEWKAVTVSGIETNAVKIEVRDNDAIIKAVGDGIFRLRCSSRNGGSVPKVISELEFEASGIGNASFDPYKLVPAGLYNAGEQEFKNGFLGGIVAPENQTSIIGFRDVEFGDIGSDEITMPIFYHQSTPLPFEIWEGIPGEEGSSLIFAAEYQSEVRWNTYQSNSFRLPNRLQGTKTLYFVIKSEARAHFQGFVFKYYEKAFEKLSAKDNNHIYGDSFTITDDAIENIGNNVSLVYEDMDFGEGFTKLIICGRSNTELNTIHVRFSGENGNTNQICEFPYSEEYVEKEFILDSVPGKQKVSFVFLPGSNFDFKWFQYK